MKVLVVNDIKDIRDLVVFMLQKMGLPDYIEAENGQDAFDKFMDPNNNFSLVITDIRMPIMDGNRLIELIRSSGKNVPILVVSSSRNTKANMNLRVENVSDLEMGVRTLLNI